MARVTVEDCVAIIPNRFELVLLASQRARDIAAGMKLTVERDNDKNAVVSLREISEQTIDFEELRRHIVRGVNRHSDMTVEDDTLLAMSSGEGFAPLSSNDVGSGSEIKEIAFEASKTTSNADDMENNDGVGSEALAAAEALFGGAESDAEASIEAVATAEVVASTEAIATDEITTEETTEETSSEITEAAVTDSDEKMTA